MLVDNEEVLNKDCKELFGKQFSKSLTELAKQKKDNKDVKKALNPFAATSRLTTRRPFRGGPSAARYAGAYAGGRGFASRFAPRDDGARARGRGDNNRRSNYRGRYTAVKWQNGVKFPSVSQGYRTKVSTKQSDSKCGQSASVKASKGGRDRPTNSSKNRTGEVVRQSEDKKGSVNYRVSKHQESRPSGRGKTATLCPQLGTLDARQADITDSNRSKNRMGRSNPTRYGKECSKVSVERREVNRRGSKEASREERHHRSNSSERTSRKSYIPQAKEERGHEASVQPEGFESTHTVSTLQTRKHEGCNGHDTAGDFMLKMDLKDAYFSVAMHKETRKFLRFRWRNKLYQFMVMAYSDWGQLLAFSPNS